MTKPARKGRGNPDEGETGVSESGMGGPEKDIFDQSRAVESESSYVMQVSPSDPSIGVGQTQQFTAREAFSKGKWRLVPGVYWESSDPTVATIDGKSGL